MDCSKIGRLICQIRKEQGLTQKKIADALNISDKTVSKWERGFGCPDVSLLPQLSELLGVDLQKILEGELKPNRPDSGNIKNTRFYVCPTCGNILFSSGAASIFCCGRKLNPLKPQLDLIGHVMDISEMDDEYFISIRHDMSKDHYISFVACLDSDKILFHRLYPEQNAEFRIPIIRSGGKLLAYCVQHGLWVQSITPKG